MNLNLLASSALVVGLGLNAPNVGTQINSFADLTRHIPEARNEMEAPVTYQAPNASEHYVPFLSEWNSPVVSEAQLNSHILFRGALSPSPAVTPDGQERVEQISAAELNCMAENIYYESRGQSLGGQLAVGLVTMNRVKASGSSKTVCDVVHERTSGDNPTCQFSWYCDGNVERVSDREAWNRAVSIASRVIQGRVQDFTRGATNFHDASMTPQWAQRLVKTITIDDMSFYREA